MVAIVPTLAVTLELARDTPAIVALTIFCAIIGSAIGTFIVNRLAWVVGLVERAIKARWERGNVD